MRKTIILVLNQYYLPGYKSGGPIRTIANMVNVLSDDFDFYIFTSDRDAIDMEVYPGITVNAWSRVQRAHVFYADKKMRSIFGICKIIRESPHDILYLNSFFNPIFTIIPLILRRLSLIPKKPVVIAPRGEFSLNAIKLKKWKKMLFVFLAKTIGEYKKFIWQASSEYEKKDIQEQFMSNLEILVAPNISSSLMQEEHPKKIKTGFSVLFLSRISPMKNIDFMLNSLFHVKENIKVFIYGPVRDEDYWLSCQKIIPNLPNNVTVSYCGSVPHDKVQEIMSTHDLFFLPTLGENYGHVISEALLCGTPALIADTTPWKNLEADGLGWDLPLSDPKLFAEKIDYCAQMSPDERLQWRKDIREKAKARVFDPSVIEANRQLFYQALAGK